MDRPSDGVRDSLPSPGAALAAAGAYFVLESLWGSLWGPGLPVGVWGFGAGLAAVGILTAVVILGLRGLVVGFPRWAPGAVAGLILGLLFLKLWLVAGVRITPVSLLGLGLPVAAALVGVRWWRGDWHLAGWSVLAALAAVMSTDVVKLVWMRTRDGEIGTVAGAAIVVATVGLGTFVILWKPVERMVRKRRVAAGVLLGCGLVVAGGVWGTTWEHGLLDRGETGGDPHFQGDVGEAAASVPPEDLPNIILISVDTLRWDMVPPHVESSEHPHLSRLRRDSLRFPRAFSTSSWTLPAHASLLSGRLPIATGAVTAENRMYSDLVLFPQYLRKVGYRTGAFTDGAFLSHKYGFSRGMDLYWEQKLPYRDPRQPYRRFTPGGLELLSGIPGVSNGTTRVQIRHRSLSWESMLRRFSRNLEAARQWLKARPEDEPFFLFLHTYQVHDYRILPHRVGGGKAGPEPVRFYPENYRRLRDERPVLASAFRSLTRPIPDPEPLDSSQWERFRTPPPGTLPQDRTTRLKRRLDQLEEEVRRDLRRRLGSYHRKDWSILQQRLVSTSDTEWESFRRRDPERKKSMIGRIFRREMPDLKHRRRRALKQLYRYGIQDVDRALGNFLDWLEDRGLYDESAIVFLSDHGEGFQLEHGVQGHASGSLHEVLIRVPLWMKLPGRTGAGRRVDAPLQIHDLFPLLMRHIGVRVPPTSRSLRGGPAWREAGPVDVPRREVVRASVARSFHNRVLAAPEEKRMKFGVRRKNVKLVSPADTDREAWSSVRYENLFERSLHPDSVPRRLRRGLRQRMRGYVALRRRFPNPFLRLDSPLDEGLQQQLRGLGYF